MLIREFHLAPWMPSTLKVPKSAKFMKVLTDLKGRLKFYFLVDETLNEGLIEKDYCVILENAPIPVSDNLKYLDTLQDYEGHILHIFEEIVPVIEDQTFNCKEALTKCLK